MIKSSLWKRMVFGYAVIALFMLVMNFYLIFRLNHLNKHSASIMMSDILIWKIAKSCLTSSLNR